MFADDTKVYNASKHHDKIQADIQRLQEWTKIWQLYFNSMKCKVLHFGKNNPKHEYFIQNDTDKVKLSQCQQENDLGVIFDENLSFDQHIQSKINKANQTLGIIKRTFSFLDIDIFLRLYKSLIRPHLEYANVIWHPHLIRQSAAIERVQRRATKLLPGFKNLSYEQRLRAIKLPTLKSRRLRGDIIQT